MILSFSEYTSMEEVVFPQRKMSKYIHHRYEKEEEIVVLPLCKIWKIRLANKRYGDVFEHYYKFKDSLVKMKQEIGGIVKKNETEEEKEKIAGFLLEYTNVLNSLNTLHIHLSSISASLEGLANIIDPNHTIEF